MYRVRSVSLFVISTVVMCMLLYSCLIFVNANNNIVCVITSNERWKNDRTYIISAGALSHIIVLMLFRSRQKIILTFKSDEKNNTKHFPLDSENTALWNRIIILYVVQRFFVRIGYNAKNLVLRDVFFRRANR